MASKSEDTIRYEVEDGVATITLDRPKVRNALNPKAYRQLENAFREAQEDAGVRCVILTGADPSFCSGDDVGEILGNEERRKAIATVRPVRPRPTPAATAILECDRPVIAAVNGAAVGWGMDVTLFCDIRIASERARFGELFVKRGLVSDIGGLVFLPEIVGPSKAAELLFTGEIVDAAEAERIGLVSRVVAHEDLMPTARELATKIAANPPLAVRFLKEGLRRARSSSAEEMGGWVSQTLGHLFGTHDHREAVEAWMQKREPKYQGK